MTMVIVCDGCKQPIDTSTPDQPWWVVTVQQQSSTSSAPIAPSTAVAPRNLHYHEDHLPIPDGE